MNRPRPLAATRCTSLFTHSSDLRSRTRRNARQRVHEDFGLARLRVFRHEIDETAKTLRLWVHRKRRNRKLICSGCGRKFSDTHDSYQREVRESPWRKYQTTVINELYRVCCPQCGVRIEKVPQLRSKVHPS